MEPEKSLTDILRGFQRRRFRYLLIGGQAVAQYGSPLMTKDYDLWIDPGDKEKIIDFLVKQAHFEAPPQADRKKPILTLYADWQKIDLFCARRLSNLEGTVLEFGACLERSTQLKDPKAKFTVVVPSVEDLIALKKMRKSTPKDAEDIAFLKTLRKKAAD